MTNHIVVKHSETSYSVCERTELSCGIVHTVIRTKFKTAEDALAFASFMDKKESSK